MLLVVDANVVFSALYSQSSAFDVFAINKIYGSFEFVAPEFLFLEIENRFDRLVSKSKLPKEEIEGAFALIKEQVEVVSSDEFIDAVPKAAQLLGNHLKDVSYVALALKLGCPIFSGEKRLKALSSIKVFSPRELLDMLSDSDI